jgi:ElaB/YqjD/DUF883 family membrane-anchored ribosome-binding protein
MAKSTKAARNGGQSISYRIFEDILALASTMAKNRKDFGAEKLQALAGATREYASSIGDLPNLRTHVSSAAESIDGLAEYVMHTDVEHILEDAGTFARRNPLATLGVSVAAGLAVSLLMRPSRSTSKPASKSKARSKARKQPAKHKRGANGTTQAHA